MADEGINLEDSGIRLSVYQKTRLDLIKDSVPKPAGYLPPKSLPTWEEFPIEQKLPLLPAPPGALYFSRGSLGKTLLRKNVGPFSTKDPLNRERIPSDKYELLHDPQTRVDADWQATKYLRTTGAINENGEVICTLQEFNRYRKYLATLYNDSVREKILQLDQLKKFEQDTTRALIRQELQEKGAGRQAIRNEKIANAKKYIAEKNDQKRSRFQLKLKLEDQRRINLEAERKRQQADKVRFEEERRALQLQRVIEKESIQLARQKQFLHNMTLKDLSSSAQREHLKKERKIVNETRLAEWFDAKVVSAAERLQRDKQIQAEYTEGIKRLAVRRQKHIERFRAGLPLRIAQRLAAKERLDNIVRKYAMRWLNRVRERLRKPRDEMHESMWYSDRKNCLADGVKYLYDQSGYEKLDDVVLNILKFKEALKKQLLMEEEEEEDEDDEDDEDD